MCKPYMSLLGMKRKSKYQTIENVLSCVAPHEELWASTSHNSLRNFLFCSDELLKIISHCDMYIQKGTWFGHTKINLIVCPII